MHDQRRAFALALSASIPLTLLNASSAGQCTHSKLLDPDRAPGDQFGYAIDMSQIPAGNAPSMLIGSWAADTAAGSNAGSARVIHRGVNGWSASPDDKILPSDGQSGDFFGASVGYEFPWAAIGATGVGETGAGYVFYYVGGVLDWSQVSKLVPPNADPGDDVGRSIDITGSNSGWVVLGSPARDADFGFNPGVSDPDAGVAYLYRFTGGAFQLTQTIPERIAVIGGAWAGDRFGAAVAIKGDVVVCGAPGATIGAGPAQHGFAQVYHYAGGNSWGTPTDLVAPDAAASDQFGSSVATDGVSIIVGAPFDDLQPEQVPGATAKNASGCAYIYRRVSGSWQLDGQLFAPDAADNARFGSSVAIDGNRAVVGAAGAKRAYLFRRAAANNWVIDGTYSDPDSSADGAFGSDVSLAVDELGIGDPTDDPSSEQINAGAAYTLGFPLAGSGADMCDGAPVVSGHGQYAGCTRFASLAGSSPCGTGHTQGPDIWFRWTPACSGPVTLDTFSSDFDTVLSVHSGCPGEAANALHCNDDGGGGLQSTLTMNTVAGQTLLIRVAGFGGARGSVTLNVNEGAPPVNDTCGAAPAITSGVYTFTTCRATTNNLTGSACQTGAAVQRDLWYRYTATCTGAVTVNTCGSNFDTVVQVFPGATCPSSNASIIACDDDSQAQCPDNPDASSVSFQATTGVAYFIQVGSRPIGGSQPGDGVLSISCEVLCPCDWNHSGLLSVQDILDFLTGFFSGSADFNTSGGTTVQDLFDFLACYFGGCP